MVTPTLNPVFRALHGMTLVPLRARGPLLGAPSEDLSMDLHLVARFSRLT